MEWPKDLVEGFAQGMLALDKSTDKEAVARRMLDQAARYAVWRAENKSMTLVDGFKQPKTPIGYLVNKAIFDEHTFNGIVGEPWSRAVDNLIAYIHEHAAVILTHYWDKGEPFPLESDSVGGSGN